ncbi:PREDICTED: uncharacterized protein LOC109180754 [Ipomoea nil]|uniref:uncharacterized protein LOC109180754 n=1 Tax=Ipomoea nil TaxID=35883 RepID=UPI000901FCD2|nr:PREDICTED: uncharacterized protein LOC109180754 [Ipomoea nil]
MDIQHIVDGAADITLEEEDLGVRFEDEPTGGIDHTSVQQTWSVVGRLLTDRNFKSEMMKRVLVSAWRPLMGIEVADVHPNLFLFTFFDEADRRRVLEEGPWAYENATLICQSLVGDEHPTQVILNSVDLWVQVFDLPIGYRTEKVLEKVGDFVGVYLRVDDRNFTRPWATFYRVRVRHDVAMPLKQRMKMIPRDGSWAWVNFKYERLHMFCYFCGKLGHTDKFCIEARRSPLKPEQYLYGPALKAGATSPAKALGEKWFHLGQERRKEIGFGGAPFVGRPAVGTDGVVGAVSAVGADGAGGSGAARSVAGNGMRGLADGGSASGVGEEMGVRVDPKRRRGVDGGVVEVVSDMQLDTNPSRLVGPGDQAHLSQ